MPALLGLFSGVWSFQAMLVGYVAPFEALVGISILFSPVGVYFCPFRALVQPRIVSGHANGSAGKRSAQGIQEPAQPQIENSAGCGFREHENK